MVLAPAIVEGHERSCSLRSTRPERTRRRAQPVPRGELLAHGRGRAAWHVGRASEEANMPERRVPGTHPAVMKAQEVKAFTAFCQTHRPVLRRLGLKAHPCEDRLERREGTVGLPLVLAQTDRSASTISRPTGSRVRATRSAPGLSAPPAHTAARCRPSRRLAKRSLLAPPRLTARADQAFVASTGAASRQRGHRSFWVQRGAGSWTRPPTLSCARPGSDAISVVGRSSRLTSPWPTASWRRCWTRPQAKC
jgi:hypothetical protein